jgi:hypothetical protein
MEVKKLIITIMIHTMSMKMIPKDIIQDQEEVMKELVLTMTTEVLHMATMENSIPNITQDHTKRDYMKMPMDSTKVINHGQEKLDNGGTSLRKTSSME